MKPTIFLILLFLLIVQFAIASRTSQSYTIQTDNINSGGNCNTSSQFINLTSVGQPVITKTMSDNFQNETGLIETIDGPETTPQTPSSSSYIMF